MSENDTSHAELARFELQFSSAGPAIQTPFYGEKLSSLPALTSARTLFSLRPAPMDQLHAYWRMEYIEAPRFPQTDRPFTELPATGDDRAALIVHRSPLSYLMLNRFPYNPGHLLAIPFREVSDLEDLTAAESADLMTIITFGKKVVKIALKPDGFNVGFNLGSAAGGSIAHLHGHVVPRWNGDTNFMPVLGQTRTLPQALESTWAKLAETARDLAPSA